MKFHSAVVFVKSIEVARDFYVGMLGLKIEHDFGRNIILEGGVSLWEVQEEHIISRELKTGGNANRFELYFETADVDAIFWKLKAEGVVFLHELQEEPWGQHTLRFFDPDGHLVEIGEPLEVFVGNMCRQGLTPEQISEKSGIALETVAALLDLKK
jgi:catechol 2,3-dioxygenase-like lactoylglutathione lyase family enzyme